MTRLTIDLPDNLHKTLKSLSVISGEAMKTMAISAIQSYTKAKIDKEALTSKEGIDELLQPVLSQYVEQIKNDDFVGRDWEDIKKEL